MREGCICGCLPPREPNPDCERCDFVCEVEQLRAELAAARERETKLRAAWPGLFGFGRVWLSGDNWEIYTQTGWIRYGKTRDQAINATAGIEEQEA